MIKDGVLRMILTRRVPEEVQALHRSLEISLELPTFLLDTVWLVETHSRPLPMRILEYAYLGWRILLFLVFGLPLPLQLTVGPYQTRLAYCVEELKGNRDQAVYGLISSLSGSRPALAAARILSTCMTKTPRELGRFYHGSVVYGEMIEAVIGAIARRAASASDSTNTASINV